MKRVNNRRFRYEVHPKEVVTMEITPIGTNGLVTAAQNGTELKNVGSKAAPKFKFTASATDGYLNFMMIEFSFVDADPANVKYEIALSGSKGGAYNDFRPITPTTPIKDPIFRFTVKKRL